MRLMSRWMQSFWIVIPFIFISCSSYQENPLIGDVQDNTICAPGGCSDLTPYASKLSVTIDGGELTSRLYDTKTDISGNCYQSTFPEGAISIAIYDINNNQIGFVSSGGQMMSFVYALSTTNTGLIKCEKGRFNAAIFTAACSNPAINGCLVPNQNYRVAVKMYAGAGGIFSETNLGISNANINLRKLGN